MKNDYILEELFVEVTNRCLLGCIHCSSCACPEASEYIPLEKLKSLINEAVEQGLKSFTISGGEPFLYPDLFELAAYIKRRNISLNIYSCGIMQSPNGCLTSLAERDIDAIAKLRPNKMIFSLHGGREAHEAITKVIGSFELTIESIKKVLAREIETELHFVPMRINAGEVTNVVQLAGKLGVKRVSLLRLVNHGRCLDDLVLTRNQEVSIYENVLLLRKKYPTVDIRMGAPYNCITMSGKPCSAGKDKLLISATGEVFPCEAFKSMRGLRPKIGQQSLSNLWYNDKLLNEIRDLSENGIPTCSSCEHYIGCMGGCHGERMLANGAVGVGRDPLCIYNLDAG